MGSKLIKNFLRRNPRIARPILQLHQSIPHPKGCSALEVGISTLGKMAGGGERANSPAWCRTWYDALSEQTRRESLLTTDYEEAKKKLTDWFIAKQQEPDEKELNPLLEDIFQAYYQGHASKLKSAERTRYAFKDWLQYFEGKTVEDIVPLEAQEEFHKWLRNKGQANSTIKRTLSCGRAAFNWAFKRGRIKAAPHIIMVPDGPSQPKGRPLEIEEINRLIEASNEPHLIAFILWMLGTGARPDAILELDWSQIDFSGRLIVLNPAGRMQTSKFRPTVKLPSTIKVIYEELGMVSKEGPLITHNGNGVKSIRTAWRNARAKAGLDAHVQPYSLRHTVARWLRMQGTPAGQVPARAWTFSARIFNDGAVRALFAGYSLPKSVHAWTWLLGNLAC